MNKLIYTGLLMFIVGGCGGSKKSNSKPPSPDVSGDSQGDSGDQVAGDDDNSSCTEPACSAGGEIPTGFSSEYAPATIGNHRIEERYYQSAPADAEAVWPQEIVAAYQAAQQRMQAALMRMDSVSRESFRNLSALDKSRKLAGAKDLARASRDRGLRQILDALDATKLRFSDSFGDYELIAETRLQDYAEKCRASIAESRDAVSLIEVELANLELTADALAGGKNTLSALTTKLDTMIDDLCYGMNSIDLFDPSYAKTKNAILASVDVTAENNAWTPALQSLKSLATPHIASYDELVKTSITRLGSAQLQSLTNSQLDQVLQAAFKLGLNTHINQWYWSDYCREAKPTSNFSAENPCGVDGARRPAAAREFAVTALQEKIKENLSEEAITDLLEESQLRAMFSDYFSILELDFSRYASLGIKEPLGSLGKLIKANSVTSPNEYRADEVLFDSSYYLKANSVTSPNEYRADEVLFDSSYYLKANSVTSPNEYRADEVLFDSSYYLKANSVTSPNEYRADKVLFDSSYYLKANSVTSPNEYRADEVYYDCLGHKKSVTACQPIIASLLQTWSSISSKMKSVHNKVRSSVQANSWEADLKATGAIVQGKFQSAATAYPRVHPNYGGDMKLIIDSIASQLGQDWLKNGKANLGHPALRIFATEIDRKAK